MIRTKHLQFALLAGIAAPSRQWAAQIAALDAMVAPARAVTDALAMQSAKVEALLEPSRRIASQIEAITRANNLWRDSCRRRLKTDPVRTGEY